MTCKDCVHYEVCSYHIDEETPMTVNECGKFKNKADFVEVVRCKDCKYKGTDDCWIAFYGEYGELFCDTWDNDYCGRGERKDT